jgi:monomeric sarcosine oxidase
VIETDVCIVGGGIMGLATARALAGGSKLHVLIIDRYGIGNEYCASNDSSRMFCFANGARERYTQMAIESLRLWKALERESGKEVFVPSGFLALEGETAKGMKFISQSYETLNRLGLPVELLEEAELRRRFPQFRAVRGLLDPGGGVLLASRALGVYRSMLRRLGVKVLDGEKVVRLDFSGRPEIETESGRRIRCKKVVLTSGAWSNSLLREGLVRVTPTRQQVVYLRPTRYLRYFRPGRFPVFAVDNYYGIPIVGAAGVKVGFHGSPEKVDPDHPRRAVDPEAIMACGSVVHRYVPQLANSEVVSSKVCLYDMTENTNFVIGADPEFRDVVYGYGFSGHGFKFAPLVGRLLTELVLEKPPSIRLERLSPVR